MKQTELKEVMDSCGVAVQELADYLGVTRQTISSHRRGAVKWTKVWDIAICYALYDICKERLEKEEALSKERFEKAKALAIIG